MRVSPRRAAATISAVLIVAGLTAVPSRATESFSFTRIAGANRYETAASAALEAFSGGATSAVIARGDAFPDALAGSYLTGVLGAPVLLTAPTSLPDATKSALDSLGVKTVYLLGGTDAISDSVATAAKGSGTSARTVNRVAGGNRYATAAKIATGQDSAGIGKVDGVKSAIVVSGLSFADALAAGPVAHAEHLPILLTPPSSLAPEASNAITSLGIKHVVIVGGTGVVSDGVKTAIQSKGASVARVAGANRYATAALVADFALSKFANFSDDGVDLATGDKFADALAAGPASGASNRALLLTATAALSSAAQSWLSAHAGTLQDGRVFGGTGAVSDATVQTAEDAASGSLSGPATGQLTFEDTANNTYRFVPDGADVGATVIYKDTDTFLVDGASATVGGFEAAATPGDKIHSVPATGTAKARHELTNVAATSIKSGTIGNVDIANHQLDIVNAVNGDALRKDIPWTGVLWSVDGTDGVQGTFEAAINEGDGLAMTGSGATTKFELTNVAVEGVANAIVAGSNPLIPTTDLQIGGLGDDPANNTNDATYQANGAPNATDKFIVDGGASDYATFSGDVTEGDVVTYTRDASVETFTLVNRAPSLIQGQATSTFDPTSGPLPNQAGGGSFTVITKQGPVDVTYAAGGAYVVDSRVASETEFESAYSAGDVIAFRAADTPSGTTQRIELTNKTLQGPVGKDTVNTADAANPPGSSAPPPNSYGVLGQDGETVMSQVTYVGATPSANTYFVNGAATTLANFEKELDAVKAGTKTATVQVQITGSGDSMVTSHHLTTVAKGA